MHWNNALLRFVVVGAICFIQSTNAKSQSAVPDASAIENAIKPLVSGYQGDVAVALHHLESGTQWSYRGKVPMPTASLIKLPVMIEAHRQVSQGRITLSQMIEVTEKDRVVGSGILTQHFSPGMRLSLRDAIRLMIVYSDNTATNLVIDAIGLPATSKTMAELGFPETQLNAKVFMRDTSIAPERSEKYGLGSTTAEEMVELLAKLYRGQLADPDATKMMLDDLVHCDDKSRFPAKLPASVRVAHKTGSVTRVRTDAGLLMSGGSNIALCVLTDNNTDTRWTDDNAGNVLAADIAKAVYDLFEPPSTAKPQVPSDGILSIGANGSLVEALQRTLNARTSPSAKISVDGDFGPATQAAVKAFQIQAQLEPTGVVDSPTWKALGPLLENDASVPPPNVVNDEVLAQMPESLDGPPLVTCGAWAIVDCASGNVIAAEKADQKMHFASTTKLMTAYIVLNYANQYPGVLDEQITFSQRADETVGSTAGVRAGEQLSIRELLYGLMLPSGNDAAVALAEHFGRKFANANLTDELSYDRFIEEMNRVAAALELHSTRYVNPHGLTHPDHQSTASDLAKLARTAMQLDSLRQYVGCRQHGCTVVGPGGYTRNIKWENTNRLLGIEGYVGVKTGTTDAAGACLVSCSQRDGRELMVVVLNSANSDARYVDSRNLHRYGWRKISQ